MSTVAETHSAAGSMAGYLFQLDIALLWLARSPIGASVGIETLDDVTRIDPAGSTEVGQSKLSYSRNLYADGNPNLWKTLNIWVRLIANEEVEIEKTQFYLLSNFSANSGFVSALKKAKTATEFRKVARNLKLIATQVSAENKENASSIVNSSEGAIYELIHRIQVADRLPSHPQEQLPLFAGAMSLPPDMAAEVVRGMRGWLLERTETAFAESQPAWIQKDIFSSELTRLIALHHDNRLVLRAAAEIEVKQEDKAAAKDAVFVKQMRWVDALTDEVLDAITDFFRSNDERTRLADKNDVGRREFSAFEGRLIDRWKGIHRVASDGAADLKHAGRIALRRTLDHREDLAGQRTSEYYLTRGTYHQLANESTADVGWHPEFRSRLRTIATKK